MSPTMQLKLDGGGDAGLGITAPQVRGGIAPGSKQR